MHTRQQADRRDAVVFRDTSPVDVDQLSGGGRKLVQDMRDIIETARVMVKEKNADDLFRNFVTPYMEC